MRWVHVVGLSLFLAAGLHPGRAHAADESTREALVRRLREMDRDGDGRLSRAELRFPRLFDRIDRDRDGFVTWEEVEDALSSVGSRDRKRAPVPDDVQAHLDLPYAQVDGVDPRLLSLDLYAPRSPGKHPVLVMIHGGGWRGGDKAHAAMTVTKVPHFVRAGFVYVSINYRLSTRPDIQHPTHVQDVARALAWIHDHVAAYGGDPEKLFVMGHSAGAHLAALVATDARRLEAEGKSLAILRGIVCLDTAAYDIPRYVNDLGAGPAMRRMYEAAFGTTEDAWRDASPRHHVARDKHIPPMLFFHTGQRLAGDRLSREIVDALRQAGTRAQTVHAADRDHAGINACIGEPDDPYTRLVMAFLADPSRAGTLTLGSAAPPVTETDATR